MKKHLIFILFFQLNCFSQETITLQECLNKMEANRLNVSQEKNAIQVASTNFNYHKLSVLPNLSAFSNLNTSFGRRLDPFTNTFGTASVNSQSYGLSTAMPLFAGFAYFKAKNKLRLNQNQAEIVAAESANRLQKSGIENYLELCKIQTQEKLSQLRILQYEEIKMAQRKLLESGRITVIDTLKNNSALVNEEKLKTTLYFSAMKRKAELNHLMGNELGFSFETSLASVQNGKEIMKTEEYFAFEKLKIDQEIRTADYENTRANFLPSVSLNGSIGSGFSTNNKDFSTNGNPTIPYDQQLEQNLNQYVGFSINLPLFNKGEWLKTRKINLLSQDEIDLRLQLLEKNLAKSKYNLEQDRLAKSAEKSALLILIQTNEDIYKKSFLLYKEGRITFTELQNSFVDWQSKLLEMETLELEMALISLYGL